MLKGNGMASERKDILAKYPDFEACIGIEVHVQLKTASKIFCRCPNEFGEQPNVNICPVCTGQPGVLPVLNRRVVDCAIVAGLATNCSISQVCQFARKHYIYPDLPKNYQITQSEPPICVDGFVQIDTIDGTPKNVRLIRIHIEEDAGKNVHVGTSYGLVNLNRAGTPLLEIVSHPDMENSHEAKAYLERLHSIIRYIGVSEANMDEGSFRADINISVRLKGQTELGTKVELKNINSFRFVAQAVEFEIERQIEMIKRGERVCQETRLWDSKLQKSTFMRSKETADDYRYFNEPDLPILNIDDAWIEKLRATIPELPHVKFTRFVSQHGLSAYEADILVQERDIAQFFDDAVALCNKPKQVANWMLRDVLGYLKEHKKTLEQTPLTPALLSELIEQIDQGVINASTAQEVFAEMMASGTSPIVIIKEKDLGQVSDEGAIEKIVLAIIASQQDSVAKYRAGNERLFMFFVGLAMKETKGKANPAVIQSLLKKHLAA